MWKPTKEKLTFGLIFSVFGAIGSILIALNVNWILFGYCFYAVSNTGFLGLIYFRGVNKDQTIMWIVNTTITIIGLINYSGLISVIC